VIALSKLRVQNLLSFGAQGAETELRPLNVLIGPNGSGKSNLIEVIGLLNSTSKDLAEPFRETGGVDEWIWKGEPKGATAIIEATAQVSCLAKPAGFRFPSQKRPTKRRPSFVPLGYKLAFRASHYQLEIVDERVQVDFPPPRSVFQPPREVFFAYENGRPMLYVRGGKRRLRPEEINPQKSVLSQRKDPEQYPELTALGRLFSSFRFYRDWEFGIGARAREASPADAPVDFLEESVRNLALMLNQLNNRPETEADLLRYLTTFYADVESLKPDVMGGRVGIRLQEKGKFSVSAARLSDGILRWMALLTILLHPSPPPLVCLEEPELGLHPDVIRPLAKLLVQASQRMQLIVTTHSDVLVDELTETPEAVIVCEKEAGATALRRLERKELSRWLKQYTLGELWHKGQIGGTRW
jgi:predicted ATPase